MKVKAVIVKSLLPSLYQREGIYHSLAKRGLGRFFDKSTSLCELFITQAEACGYNDLHPEEIR